MRVSDLRDWTKSVSDFISEEESKEYCDFLEAFRKEHKDLFEKEMSEELVHGGALPGQDVGVVVEVQVHRVDPIRIDDDGAQLRGALERETVPAPRRVPALPG